MNIDVIVRNQNNDKTGGEENEKNPWYCFSYNRNYSSIIPVTISVVLGIVLLVIGVFVMIRNYKKK